MHITDQDFEAIIAEAIDTLPERYTKNMNNVAIVFADDPTPEQRYELKLRGDQTLFGLYQGIPLIRRDAGYNLVLPDKITIFKNPLVMASRHLEDLKDKVRHTLWHEVAHHFGLDHLRIDELDSRRRPNADL